MKLARFETAGQSRPRLGVVVGEDSGAQIVPLDTLSEDWPTMLSIVAGGDAALAAVSAHVSASSERIALSDVTLLAPIERPAKFLAIGMNYRKHAEEARRLGVAVPENQFWFNKQTSCLAGPYDAIDPGVSEALDYEVELGVVIGKPAKGITEEQAPAHVFGYTVMNDVSARDWQKHSPPSPWARASTPMARSAPGSSRRMKSVTRTASRCVASSMARCGRTATPAG
jgi:2-keto-4-pentenoate hydratase/2-oxohepta-3-ene-1,7-dioic acid hydratase in catechol pathway